MFHEKYVKRPQDLICASLAAVVLSPVMLITAILEQQKLGTPSIFSQECPEKDGKIFRMYKFRTMTDEDDKNGALLFDIERLIPFGAWLCGTSLDELPELINVIRGECAVCGK